MTSITGDAGSGIALTYSYDTQNPPRLIRVTHADGKFESFNYDANSKITSVTDTDGKILESHTYDSANRGLSSSRALNVDKVTIAYPTQ